MRTSVSIGTANTRTHIGISQRHSPTNSPLPTYLPIYLSTYLSIYLSIYLPTHTLAHAPNPSIEDDAEK